VVFSPQLVVEGVEHESIWFFLPPGTDGLVGCEAFESLESFDEVVGHEECLEMLFQVLVGLVVKILDGGFFEGSVHAFDLAVGPGDG